MKRFLTVLSAMLLLTAVLAGCGQAQPSQAAPAAQAPAGSTAPISQAPPATPSESAAPANTNYRTVEQIQQAGTLNYYTDAVWAPFEYIGEGGNPVGVDVDIATKIAEKIGVELNIVNASFDGFTLALQNGQADLAIAAITITDECKEAVDFSDPYTICYQNIVLLEDNTTTTDIETLAGMRIGAHLGTTGDFLASDAVTTGPLQNTGASVVQYKSLQEACLAMLSGNLDAIVVDDFLARNLVAVNPGLKCIEAKFADGSIDEENYGIALTKGNETLLKVCNEVLAEMKANGEIDSSLDFHTQAAAIVE